MGARFSTVTFPSTRIEDNRKFDYLFPKEQWRKYDNFADFEKDFLEYHNYSNFPDKQQEKLTLYYDRGCPPMVAVNDTTWTPDPEFDSFADPVSLDSILAVHNKGNTIQYAATNYFSTSAGQLYETVGWSFYHDKMTIRLVEDLEKIE
jgi:hypothetical protein